MRVTCYRALHRFQPPIVEGATSSAVTRQPERQPEAITWGLLTFQQHNLPLRNVCHLVLREIHVLLYLSS